MLGSTSAPRCTLLPDECLYARMPVVMTVVHILRSQLLPEFAVQRAQLIIHDHTPTTSWPHLLHTASHQHTAMNDTSVAVVQLRETYQVSQSKSVINRLKMLSCTPVLNHQLIQQLCYNSRAYFKNQARVSSFGWEGSSVLRVGMWACLAEHTYRDLGTCPQT